MQDLETMHDEAYLLDTIEHSLLEMYIDYRDTETIQDELNNVKKALDGLKEAHQEVMMEQMESS